MAPTNCKSSTKLSEENRTLVIRLGAHFYAARAAATSTNLAAEIQ